MSNQKTTKEVSEMLASNGWLTVKRLFDSELDGLERNKVDKNLPADEYKIESLANAKAHQIITSILETVKGLAGIEKRKTKKYV